MKSQSDAWMDGWVDGWMRKGAEGSGEESVMDLLTADNRWVANQDRRAGEKATASQQETDYDKCHSIIA